MSALRHGSLEGQDLSLLTGNSLLRHRHGGFVQVETKEDGTRFISDPYWPTVWADFAYIGERDADCWIHPPKGGWTGEPVPHSTPDLHVRCRNGVEHTAAGFASHYWQNDGDSNDIIAFRLAHPAPEQVASGREVTDFGTPTYSADRAVENLRNRDAARTPSAQADRGEPVAWLIEWTHRLDPGTSKPGGGSEIIRNQYAAVEERVQQLKQLVWMETVVVTPLAPTLSPGVSSEQVAEAQDAAVGGLLERLEAASGISYVPGHGSKGLYRNPDGPEAASVIRRLSALHRASCEVAADDHIARLAAEERAERAEAERDAMAKDKESWVWKAAHKEDYFQRCMTAEAKIKQSEAERDALREALEPFARLAPKFDGATMVEVSLPHPNNPSSIIQPLPVSALSAARAALAMWETGQ